MMRLSYAGLAALHVVVIVAALTGIARIIWN